MNAIIKQVRQSLKESRRREDQGGSQRFFKEKIKSHGMKVPVVQKIGKLAFASLKDKPKAEILELCEELWRSGYRAVNSPPLFGNMR